MPECSDLPGVLRCLPRGLVPACTARGRATCGRDGRRYWRHVDFGLRLLRATIVDDDGREFVEHLQCKRVQADCYPDEIEVNEAAALTDEARAFLESRELRSS